MHNLTFVIFAYNEEKRIQGVIENLKGYGEILIIDNSSTDNTKIIAENLGAEILEYKNQGYVETKEELDFVKKNLKTEYMTWSFCDWVWPISLLEKLLLITNENKCDGIDTIQFNYHYGIENLNFLTFFGNFGKKNWKGFQVAFKKDCIEIDGLIHSNVKITCKNISYLPRSKEYYVHHLSVYDVSKFELAHNRYSNIESKMLFNSGIKASLFRIMIKILYFFVKFYIIEGGYKSGKTGLIMVMQYMFFYFNTWAKTYELENNITIESIENNYKIIRSKIINE